MGCYITLDHIIPLRKGGDHSDGNLVACCHWCNWSKGDRTPEEWRRDESMLDSAYGDGDLEE